MNRLKNKFTNWRHFLNIFKFLNLLQEFKKIKNQGKVIKTIIIFQVVVYWIGYTIGL